MLEKENENNLILEVVAKMLYRVGAPTFDNNIKTPVMQLIRLNTFKSFKSLNIRCSTPTK